MNTVQKVFSVVGQSVPRVDGAATFGAAPSSHKDETSRHAG